MRGQMVVRCYLNRGIRNIPLVSSVSVLEKSHEFTQVKFAISGKVIS